MGYTEDGLPVVSEETIKTLLAELIGPEGLSLLKIIQESTEDILQTNPESLMQRIIESAQRMDIMREKKEILQQMEEENPHLYNMLATYAQVLKAVGKDLIALYVLTSCSLVYGALRNQAQSNRLTRDLLE